MGLYKDVVLPRFCHLAMRNRRLLPYRKRTVSRAEGRVLEIGVGSGLNLPFYRAPVRELLALEPSPRLLAMARRLAAKSPFPISLISFIEGSAEAIPIEGKSVDTVVSTWTLCTIPDAMRALAEIRRVLRPGGAFRFVEHGLAPDPGVARLQQRLTPLQRRAFGGCHLNRPIDQLVAAAGLELTQVDSYYMKGPQRWEYTFEGVAIRP